MVYMCVCCGRVCVWGGGRGGVRCCGGGRGVCECVWVCGVVFLVCGVCGVGVKVVVSVCGSFGERAGGRVGRRCGWVVHFEGWLVGVRAGRGAGVARVVVQCAVVL